MRTKAQDLNCGRLPTRLHDLHRRWSFPSDSDTRHSMSRIKASSSSVYRPDFSCKDVLASMNCACAPSVPPMRFSQAFDLPPINQAESRVKISTGERRGHGTKTVHG